MTLGLVSPFSAGWQFCSPPALSVKLKSWYGKSDQTWYNVICLDFPWGELGVLIWHPGKMNNFCCRHMAVQRPKEDVSHPIITSAHVFTWLIICTHLPAPSGAGIHEAHVAEAPPVCGSAGEGTTWEGGQDLRCWTPAPGPGEQAAVLTMLTLEQLLRATDRVWATLGSLQSLPDMKDMRNTMEERNGSGAYEVHWLKVFWVQKQLWASRSLLYALWD